jgi:putative hydrolase of the HAD superfamily
MIKAVVFDWGGVLIDNPLISTLLDQSFRASYREREDVFTLASRLHRRSYKTALLSNTEAPGVRFFHEKKYPMFDEAFFSCMEGVSKPDQKIYQTVLDRIGARPQTVLFIDDSPENVRGAAHTGMTALLFKNSSRLRRDLLALSMEI